MGVQFIKPLIHKSTNPQIHQYRYTHREDYFRKVYPQLSTIQQWMHELWESMRKGHKQDDEETEAEQGEDDSAGDSDAAGWTTDEGEEEREERFRDDPPQDPGDESSNEEVEVPLCDDIHVQ